MRHTRARAHARTRGCNAQRVGRTLALPLLQHDVSDVAQTQQLGEGGVVDAAGEQQAAVRQFVCDAAGRVFCFLRNACEAAAGKGSKLPHLVWHFKMDEEIKEAMNKCSVLRSVVAV